VHLPCQLLSVENFLYLCKRFIFTGMQTTNEYLRKLQQFKEQYSSEYEIERIGIFGSVARGEHTGNSDIDIYYEGKSLGLKSLVEFPMQLEKFFGVHVDVVRKHNNMRPTFVKRIMKDIVYV
jgi:predicted nucleotidyltransferase